jgi:glycosyltransferase involved in cell wall biosynthesis
MHSPGSGGYPFITFVTPVYNGEAYLAECIESVLAQDYPNWEYVIVNNCSTDGSLGIAESYARRDSRIRVRNNDEFVNAEENHNNGFRLVSPESQYCKVVSADDWLLPDCTRRMVDFAVQHPSAGIIGAYQVSGGAIKWRGLPQDQTLLSGREACRLGLLQGLHFFGNPTSSLYRCDLLRRTSSFFPHGEPHADTSACYAHLHDCDYGFIHEALSVERTHGEQISSGLEDKYAGDLAFLDLLTTYGPAYLTQSELEERLDTVLRKYYERLGAAAWKGMGREFWSYHASAMQRLGLSLSKGRIARHAFTAALRATRNPQLALRVLSGKASRRDRTEVA